MHPCRFNPSRNRIGAPAHGENQNGTGDEPAEMRKPAHLFVAPEERGDDLKSDPEADRAVGRHLQRDALQEQPPHFYADTG